MVFILFFPKQLPFLKFTFFEAFLKYCLNLSLPSPINKISLIIKQGSSFNIIFEISLVLVSKIIFEFSFWLSMDFSLSSSCLAWVLEIWSKLFEKANVAIKKKGKILIKNLSSFILIENGI